VTLQSSNEKFVGSSGIWTRIFGYLDRPALPNEFFVVRLQCQNNMKLVYCRLPTLDFQVSVILTIIYPTSLSSRSCFKISWMSSWKARSLFLNLLMISGAMIRLFTGFLACLTISFSNFRSPSPTRLIDLKRQICLGFLLPGIKTDYPGLPNRPHCQMVSNTVNSI
jgi:hypothetical protein